MKKLVITIAILVFFLSSTFSFAQGKISDRLSISLSGGPSVPIAEYAGNNAAESASYGPEEVYPSSFIIGFSKEKTDLPKSETITIWR